MGSSQLLTSSFDEQDPPAQMVPRREDCEDALLEDVLLSARDKPVAVLGVLDLEPKKVLHLKKK